MLFSILEQAKRQDEEREIQKDEQIYQTTGKNIAYDENAPDPLVPIDGRYEPGQNELSNAQRAKIKRIVEKQKKLTENRQKQTGNNHQNYRRFAMCIVHN